MHKVWDFLGNFNNAASILLLLGVPLSAITTGIAAVVAHIEHLRISYLAVLVLLVFGLTLWSWIGLVWLFDRAGGNAGSSKRQTLDCSWGLVLENPVLKFDANSPVERQVQIVFRNVREWPLRVEIISRFLEIENTTPDMQMANTLTPFIVLPSSPVIMNFPGYSKGKLPDQERIRGKIDIVAKYGHPDIGYSRTMSRWLHFDQVMKPNMPEGLFPNFAMLPLHQVPLNAGPYKEDEDKPFKESKAISPPT